MKHEKLVEDIEQTAATRLLVRQALYELGIIARFLPNFENRLIDEIVVQTVLEYEEITAEELAERVYSIEVTLKTIAEQQLELTKITTDLAKAIKKK